MINLSANTYYGIKKKTQIVSKYFFIEKDLSFGTNTSIIHKSCRNNINVNYCHSAQMSIQVLPEENQHVDAVGGKT